MEAKKYNKRALTVQEAADYACVSRSTVDNWLSRGLVPFEELPSRGTGAYSFKRIRKTDLDAFLDKHHQIQCIPDKPNKNNEFRELILLPRDS